MGVILPGRITPAKTVGINEGNSTQDTPVINARHAKVLWRNGAVAAPSDPRSYAEILPFIHFRIIAPRLQHNQSRALIPINHGSALMRNTECLATAEQGDVLWESYQVK